MRILLVEDEAALADALVGTLEDACYAVDWAADGPTADELMSVNPYDLAILDWSIPPPTGIDLLKQWRHAGHSLPILMLTGRTGVTDRVEGLDHGADDYLTKPFALEELLARVRTLLRRAERSVPAPLEAGDLVMDRAQRVVTIAGRPVPLAPKEFAILEYLLQRLDQVVSRTELTEHVWDDSFDYRSNVVDVLVHRLRKKVDAGRSGRLLHTHKGAGYRLSSRRS